MKWFVIGTGAVLGTNDPQVGNRLLSMSILMACFILPLFPVIMIWVDKKINDAVNKFKWFMAVMFVIALSGIIGIVYIAVTRPLVNTTLPILIISLVSMIAGILIMRLAVKVNSSSYKVDIAKIGRQL